MTVLTPRSLIRVMILHQYILILETTVLQGCCLPLLFYLAAPEYVDDVRTYMAKFYKHVKDIVHSGVNDVLLDMFRIQTMIGFCANTTYGEQERIDAFMSRAAEIVGRIADHTEKWRINNEDRTWPEIMVSATRRDLNSTETSLEEYSTTAIAIEKEFVRRGSDKCW
ncbi:hypothetical protein QR680_005288 [Steinernema hermaphroditum]|uniref:Uncharacterized protein n=1 Tax=Steinernema hermaphroditum TaxID=289476 RepID=A0AA39HSV0_9BILA|nr:hypothetical protein QR680_005288 [Steinernema hermaphroditum]